jgi:hypothetical protein
VRLAPFQGNVQPKLVFGMSYTILKKLDDNPHVAAEYLIEYDIGDSNRKQGYISHRKPKSFTNIK